MRLLLAALLLAAAPQDRPPAPPLPDAGEKPAPGLTLAFENASGRDVRHARVAAFHVPEGASPSPFLAPGPFKAVLEGFVTVDLGTDAVFSAQGAGTLSVTANEKPALEASGDFSKAEGKAIRLRKGKNRLVARYESPPKGDAWLRLSWMTSDFAREPISPRDMVHDSNGKELRGARRLREGREIVAARRCARCHAHEAKGMPELTMDAPSLAEAGTRLHPAWMASWILDPRAIRPEATMPRVAGISEQDAADLAAWLAGLGKPAEAKADGDAKAGGLLFAEMRCVACHTLPGKDPAPDRIPLRHVAAKWRPGALRTFLKAPAKHYAWIEMPDFGMTDDEAARLEAFLLSAPAAPLPKTVGAAGDPARGQARAQALGCLACHAAPGTNALKAAPLASIPAAAWSRGCGPADFGFTPPQREALLAFAATDLSSLARDADPEFAERQIAALRCSACHKRDDRHDLWSDLQDETKHLLPPKKVDEDAVEIVPAEPVVPSLTWTGEKLKPEWMEAFLRGGVKERPRPWLGALRMPSFASRARGLAQGLVLGHGCPPASPVEPAPDAALADIGRQLSGPNGGLDCLSCHGIGERKATKVFEAPAPNFRLARERLRKDYFLRWVAEPLRLEPGTKMPQFFEQGRTKLTEILDGDAGKQIDSLWQYLLEGEKIRPPSD